MIRSFSTRAFHKNWPEGTEWPDAVPRPDGEDARPGEGSTVTASPPASAAPLKGGAEIETVTVAAAELRQLVERIERLNEELQSIQQDKAELFAEAKGRGYDTKALKAIVKLRAKDPNERAEEEAVLDLYKNALGMS